MWKSANSHKKPPPLKHILALPTLGQECLRSETELIEKVNFDLGHPVFMKNVFQKKRLFPAKGVPLWNINRWLSNWSMADDSKLFGKIGKNHLMVTDY